MTNNYCRVKCLVCGTVLTSRHRHDYVSCPCANEAFSDGGEDYSRYGAVDLFSLAVWDYELSRWLLVKTANKKDLFT